MRIANALEGNVGDRIPERTGRGQRCHQPAAGVETLLLLQCNHDEDHRHQLGWEDEDGEDGIKPGEDGNRDVVGQESKSAVQGAEDYRNPRGNDQQAHQAPRPLQLQQVNKQEPLRHLAHANERLHDGLLHNAGDMQAKPVEDDLGQRHEGVDSHPEQKTQTAVTQPEQKAENGGDDVQRGKSKAKLRVL